MKRMVSIFLALAFLASLAGTGFASQPDAFSCSNVTQIPQIECEALVALYNSTNGWFRTTNWLVTNTPGNWYGVTVQSGHVVTLDLWHNRLTGNIPPQLGNLNNLKWLYLDENQLTGSIPPELGDLSNLIFLDLGENQLTGSIPLQLGSMQYLQALHLDSNQLTGSIPPELGNLSNLLGLYLGGNQLTGSIPLQLGNLTNLWQLNLNANQLTGNIPAQLGNLTNLEKLVLGSNQLTGSIPPQLGNLTNLTELALHSNRLTGSIPSQLGNLINLEWLYLPSNQLSGSIPPQLGNLTNLVYLYLSSNQLTGGIPPQLGNLTNLLQLNLNANQLTGSIPPELGNLVNLSGLSLSSNQLSGKIPLSFTSLVNLNYFGFQETYLCEPTSPEFLAWKATVIQWYGTGLTCYLYDIGFRPNPNGYSFDNYGGINGADYTIQDMWRMFGVDAVCWTVGSVCYRRPGARKFLLNVHEVMKKGHCDGMATTSLRIFQGKDVLDGQAAPYGLNENSGIQVNWQGESFETTLRRNIAFFFTEQLTNPVKFYKNVVRRQLPSEIKDQLSAILADGRNPATLFINQADKGHTVTPYAISDEGNGIYYIWVYDNNKHDDSSRYVVIDTINETWSYRSTYYGNADTHSLGFVPISVYAERPKCSWCIFQGDEDPESEIWFQGSGHVLITNSQNQRLGYTAEGFVSEIPGAYESVIDGGLGIELEPIYTLPLTDTYTIALNGLPDKEAGESSLTQFGPGYAVWLDDLWMDSGTADTLTIANDGTAVTYQPSQVQEATLGLALDIDQASYLLEIRQADFLADESRTLAADTAGGKLVIDGSSAAAGLYNLVIQRTSSSGWQPFYHRDIPLAAGEIHYANYNEWDGTGTLTLDVDWDGDGTPDETLYLENQMTTIFLPAIVR